MKAYSEEELSNIKKEYSKVKPKIASRIEDFKDTWREGDEEIIKELVFCILTPQSKAKECWKAVERIEKKGLLKNPSEKEILACLKGVRFKYKKARYVEEALKRFYLGEYSLKDSLSKFKDPVEARAHVVSEVKGLGYKEGSHFLRNIGIGLELAILDRHILKNLDRLDVVDELPKCLTKKRYLELERKMIEFSNEVGIPLPHLDLLLWYLEAGEVFK